MTDGRRRPAPRATTLLAALLAVALAVVVPVLAGPALLGPGGAADAAARYVSPLKAETFYTSSMYGPRCLPVANASAWHIGIDLEAQNGAPIYAVAAGTVTHAVNPKNGNAGYVMVKSSGGGVRYDLVYVHMAKATKYVHAGQKVKAGQRIALVGSSGPATSPNLHLEVWKGGYGKTHVNPSTWLRARGVSIARARIFDQGVKTPTSCTYYSTATRLNIRSGPSTGYRVLKTVPRNTKMISKPGKKTNNFVPVTVGTTRGWASAAYVSPTKVGSGGTTKVTYVVTHDTWMRVGPTTAYKHVKAVKKGTRITVVYAHIKHSRDVSVGGKRGFVLDARLRRG
ncbi:peptidoglycan DD-metalloendopeptidase family protein [Luteimicrobium sp. NPDC057192]|uniref:peptidoglycan DD-metalloendopeptidase family protein n=1 Tax=Luteimicrobium sp. NPDC057192 TaxID=3346042 RepID=UPI00362547F2